MNFGPDQVKHAILYLIAFILSITVHEFGHAFMATRLGDSKPKNDGRLTLSPVHHIDPIGTIVLPLLMAFGAPFALFAWGRPVAYNPGALTRRLSLRTGQMLVAVSGPLMNLLMAIVVSIIMVIASHLGAPKTLLGAMFMYLVQLNLSLMIFNLLPIPPLDGGNVLAWALPRSMQHIVDFLARWGSFILLFMVIGSQVGMPFMKIISIPIQFLSQYWLLGLAYLL